jgi:hypothetical protein
LFSCSRTNRPHVMVLEFACQRILPRQNISLKVILALANLRI